MQSDDQTTSNSHLHLASKIAESLQESEIDKELRSSARSSTEFEKFVDVIWELLGSFPSGIGFDIDENAWNTFEPADPDQLDDDTFYVCQLLQEFEPGLLRMRNIPAIGGTRQDAYGDLIYLGGTEKLHLLLKLEFDRQRKDSETSEPQLATSSTGPIRTSAAEVHAEIAEPDSGVASKSVTDQAEDLDLDHSRRFDVHKWSDHLEVNVFVDEIYEAHFEGGNTTIRKKHLKVILLDLYLAWCDDPDLKLAVHRNVNRYKVKSRYNEIHISKLTPEIVDQLEEVKLVNSRLGFFDRREGGKSRVSRMWPTDALIKKFKEARFGPLDIDDHPNRETIILRDDDGKNIEYDDNDDTNRMRGVLTDYNALLRDTFIDIPVLEKPFIELKPDKKGKSPRLGINQRGKFVRRIFNRGSFDKGGRFWGGWWQRCPKEWRGRIFINDEQTNEIDYSGLHIVMLYADQGIDYWLVINNDPYQIDVPDFLDTEDETRDIAKRLFLVALNARNEKSAYQAFRNEAETGTFEKSLKNDQLGQILNSLKAKHPPIEPYIASDAGIGLMNRDAAITETIIQEFTQQGIPILTIHDSYIVQHGKENLLENTMRRAFREVTGNASANLKPSNEALYRVSNLRGLVAISHRYLETMANIRKKFEFYKRTKRYKYQMEEFRRNRPQ